jgi:hypothetical protein
MKHQKILTTLLGAGIITSTFAESKAKVIEIKHSKHSSKLSRKLNETKQITLDIPTNKLTNIYLDNDNRTIIIKSWNEQKVRIFADIFMDANNANLTNEALLEKFNISTRKTTSTLKIKTSFINDNTKDDTEILSANGDYSKTGTNKKNSVTIYIPKDNNFNLESKYSDIEINGSLNKIDIDITNGSLTIENSNSLLLKSKYADVSISEVKNAEIDFINGKLKIEKIGSAEMDTKYATIEIGVANKLNFKSTNDIYEIEQLNNLEGVKNYGDLRIGKLLDKIELDGTNAEIKIKTISSTVKSITIDNKYASLMLPLKDLRNFELNYSGAYSSIYNNFNKLSQKSENSDKATHFDQNKITTDNQNTSFKTVIGNGKDCNILIKCQNCMVDFR